MFRFFLYAPIFVLLILDESLAVSKITTKAKNNFVKIDTLNVEKNWPAGVHVNWLTGIPDGVSERKPGKHTHCSAFAAAAAEILGIYLLRPPQHGQNLLANAQVDWLESQNSQKQGWSIVDGYLEAQNFANNGDLVIAVFKNHNPQRPGHIAVVRPSEKDDDAIKKFGPEITQAGLKNYLDTTLTVGFSGHPQELLHHEIKFYRHSVQ